MGSQHIIRSRVGYQQKKRQRILDDVYPILYKKLADEWCSGTCVPCPLAPLRGAYCTVCCDIYVVQMQCYTLLYTFPCPDIMRMSIYAYQGGANAYCDSYTSRKKL